MTFKFSPKGLIRPEIPLFEDLTSGMPSSIDLNRACVKCCFGPLKSPNQPSLLMLTNKLVLSDKLLRT